MIFLIDLPRVIVDLAKAKRLGKWENENGKMENGKMGSYLKIQDLTEATSDQPCISAAPAAFDRYRG
jgi:hypothetical protein